MLPSLTVTCCSFGLFAIWSRMKLLYPETITGGCVGRKRWREGGKDGGREGEGGRGREREGRRERGRVTQCSCGCKEYFHSKMFEYM